MVLLGVSCLLLSTCCILISAQKNGTGTEHRTTHRGVSRAAFDESKAIRFPLTAHKRIDRLRSRQIPLDPAFGNAGVEYTLPIGLGTPPQYFNLLLDTGSSDLWVVGTGCVTCKESKFDETKSSTFEYEGQDSIISYGNQNSGEHVLMKTAYETMTFSPNTTVTHQRFDLAYIVTEQVQGSGFDGIFGAAFPKLADLPNTVMPTQNLIDQNVTTNPSFGVELNVNDDGGEVFFGGFNMEYNGEFMMSPIQATNSGDYAFWVINVDSLMVPGTQETIGGPLGPAMIDTGTHNIMLPTAVAESLASYLADEEVTDQYGGTFFVPCNNQKTVVMSFNGNLLEIPARVFVGQPSPMTGWCYSTFTSSPPSEGVQTILGNVFLKYYYTVFDYSNPPSIYFAPTHQEIGIGGNKQ
ncbi:acid protease [Hesseltinella vesiculosa]|uniref:Acid protease n=1 Tax=Hesseltinella vesiculosa TaxID=101127 RepID=A0A1X2GW52_9FUNG|nr:acid protease [Hesseltinella vesiculosa]